MLPEHLLRALLEQKEGAVPAILSKLGVNTQQLSAALQAYLDRQPKVYGAESYLGTRLRRILDAAWTEMERLKDEYLSTEHLLLAIADESNAEGARILQAAGVTKDKIFQALTQVRGSTRVTDAAPESKFQVRQTPFQGKCDPTLASRITL